MAKITYDDKELRCLFECSEEMSKLDDIDARRRVIDYLVARFVPQEADEPEIRVVMGEVPEHIREYARDFAAKVNAMKPTTEAPGEATPDDLEVNP